MTFPTSTHVDRLHVESRHRPAAQGGGGDIHDVMATPFGVRLLVGDAMGTGAPANQTGLIPCLYIPAIYPGKLSLLAARMACLPV
jgi:hypothetical protein